MFNSGESGKKPVTEAQRTRARKAKLEPLRPDTKQTLRKTGIDILGDAPWGTHFCLFYHTKQDVIDILVPYFKAGLEDNEYCMWITSDFLTEEEAKRTMGKALPNFEDCLRGAQIEILSHAEWYLKDGPFSCEKVLEAWGNKLDYARANNYAGIRVAGDGTAFGKRYSRDLAEYEERINEMIGKYPMIALCTYSLGKCGGAEVIDVVSNHQHTLIRRKGKWGVVENRPRKRVEEAIQRQSAVLDGINRVFREALTCETEEELGKTCLAVAEKLTGSKFGFIDEVNPAGRADVIALSDPGWEACRMPRSNAVVLLKGMEIRGIWGRVLKDGQSMIVNDPASHPDSVGTPKGHPPITSFLGVPLKHAGKTIGLIGLANKDGGYDVADKEVAERLSIAIVEALRSKRAEEALRKSEEHYRMLTERINEGLAQIDRNGKYVYANRKLGDILGYSPDEIVGRHWTEFYDRDAQEIIKSKLTEGRKGVAEPYEVATTRRDGRRIYVCISPQPIFDAEGKFKGSMGIIMDITERKEAEQEARDAHQELIEQQRHEKEHGEAELAKVRDELVRTTRLAAIGQVSASIAHDLRNPLGAVRNASYFLRRRLSKDEPKASEHLAIIDQEVVKADQIITNLLEMARPKAPNKRAVDLVEMVNDVFGQTRGTEAVRCLTSVVPDPFEVWADPHQLWQVISNIVSNAAEAIKGHGEFVVEATRGSNYDTLVFRDTGPGFAPEVRDRLFEPLVTTKASGTGLGLTICRQIVEKHGGIIDAEDCEGHGAAIRIRLPRQ